ncbi:hypothetical protein QBC38DRAFT_451127 [Podospora fimiseda]|uniref:BHLH domain-containing protein n=1 Tax=Podospora fimiseda TaxID=252190 RepID=A0AAN7H576_9PEZI|nr:hypothetical protein QBC38DRAFT_451127 [Podospora fimiseda]
MPQDSRMQQQGTELPFFDFSGEHTEVINTAGFFGAGHLHQLGLGPPYHPTTPTASATSPSVSGQAHFSQYRQPSTTRVVQSPNGFPLVTTATYSSYPPQPLFGGTGGGDWQRPQVYSNDASPALSSLSSASYAAAQQTNNIDPYMGDFISAQAMEQEVLNNTAQQQSLEYNPWIDNTLNMALSPSSGGSLASPIMSAGGSNSEQQTTSGGEMIANLLQPRQQQLPKADITMSGTSSRSPPNPPPSKQQPKLRSASRTSKNVQIRPDETPRERKSRNSHNLVEKQYRNRLNLQFESLMSALPDSMKNGVISGGRTTNSDGLGEGLDIGEKKLSKAQVLDMSTRYIKSLERERENLERENNELVQETERLRHELEKEQGVKRDEGGGRGGRGGSSSSGGGGRGYDGTFEGFISRSGGSKG